MPTAEPYLSLEQAWTHGWSTSRGQPSPQADSFRAAKVTGEYKAPSQLWNTKGVGCAILGSVDGDVDGRVDCSMVVWVRLKHEWIDTCMMCLGVDGGETGGWVKG